MTAEYVKSRKDINNIASELVGAPSQVKPDFKQMQHAEAFFEFQRTILASAANLAFNEDRSGNVPNYYSAIKLLKARNVDKPEATINEFFDTIAEKTFIQVQTPHPTEVWGEEAIKAQRRLRKFVDANIREILSGEIGADVREGLKTRFEKLQSHMDKPYWDVKGAGGKVVKEPKKTAAIAQKDSIISSERFYRASEYIVVNMVKAFAANDIEITPERVMQELAKRKFAEWHTWAPGDNDGNPKFTLTELKRGSRLQLEAVNRRYILDLAIMASQLPDGADKDGVRRVISSLIHTINERSDKAEGKLADWAEELKSKNGIMSDAAQQILAVIEIRKENIASLGDPITYEDINQFQVDLNKLSEKAAIAELKTKVEGVELSSIELLKLNSSIFGERAQKAEYRQNTAVFRIAFDEVCKLLNVPHADPESLLLTIRNHPEFAKKAKEIIAKYLTDNKEKFDELLTKYIGKDNDIPIGYRKMFYTYDLLTKLQAIAADPEGYPTVLEAECGGFRDIMMGQFMLELMHKGPEKPTNRVCGLFESPEAIEQIIPTVEKLKQYQDDIVVMVAGSDLLKSGGTSGKVLTKDFFNKLEKLALDLESGKKITVYLGNGSATHRNSVVLEFYRTTQGIEMRLNGPADVAAEYQAVVSRYISDKIRRENGREDDRRKPTAHDALMNLSNILNFTTAEQDPKEQAHRKRMAEYQEKYGSVVFGSFVDTLANELDGAVSTAPRPPFRPNYAVLDAQVAKLFDQIAASRFSVDETQVAFNKINDLLGINIGSENIKDKNKSVRLIVEGIEKKFPWCEDPMKDFLDAVNPASLPENNPIRKVTLESVQVREAEKGPEKMRAIGYGSNLYIAAWGAVHAYFDVSEFADERAVDGRLNDPKEAAKTYLKSPYTFQDTINRSIYNQAMFEPDMGLKFLEARFKGKFTIAQSFDEDGKLVFDVKIKGKTHRVNAEDYFVELNKPFGQRDEAINSTAYNLAGFFKQNLGNTPEIKGAYEATMSSMVEYWEATKANCTAYDLLIELALHDKVIEPREALYLKDVKHPCSADIRNLIKIINEDLGHELNEKAGILAQKREFALKDFSEFVKEADGLKGKELKDATAKLQSFEELGHCLREIKRIAESPLEVAKHSHYFAKDRNDLALAA